MTTTRVDVEEIESTRSEKALATVLLVFLLIGAMWTYVKLDDFARHQVAPARASAQELQAIERESRAGARMFAAQNRVARTEKELQLAREAYRTALDAGRAAPELERAYRLAQARYAAANVQLRTARAQARAAAPRAGAAQRSLAERRQTASNRQAWIAALLRLGFVALLLAAGYWLLARLRRRRTRYLPLAFAVIGAAAVLAIVLAGDYVTDYIDPLELGPLVLSLFGIAATVAAFAALQRWLAQRTPLRRVRKGECPFCGFPVRAGGEHCEGCGREVVGACAACGSERRVGTAHCAACGAV